RQRPSSRVLPLVVAAAGTVAVRCVCVTLDGHRHRRAFEIFHHEDAASPVSWYPASSTAARTASSEIAASPVTCSRPDESSTSTPVTPAISPTSSRTEAAQWSQVIPATVYVAVEDMTEPSYREVLTDVTHTLPP